MTVTVSWATADEILGGTWARYRAEGGEAPMDFELDPDTGRVTNSRGMASWYPDLFTAVPRPNADDGRPRSPYYVLTEGVELPPQE